jgi:hypothetical protein
MRWGACNDQQIVEVEVQVEGRLEVGVASEWYRRSVAQHSKSPHSFFAYACLVEPVTWLSLTPE